MPNHTTNLVTASKLSSTRKAALIRFFQYLGVTNQVIALRQYNGEMIRILVIIDHKICEYMLRWNAGKKENPAFIRVGDPKSKNWTYRKLGAIPTVFPALNSYGFPLDNQP
jgi:hypothetical protein